jgi:hypothetical protein
MSVKVKRGLGLLAVAALGYLVVGLGQSAPAGATADLIEMLGWATIAAGMIGGLLLLAWGLLRD